MAHCLIVIGNLSLHIGTAAFSLVDGEEVAPMENETHLIHMSDTWGDVAEIKGSVQDAKRVIAEFSLSEETDLASMISAIYIVGAKWKIIARS